MYCGIHWIQLIQHSNNWAQVVIGKCAVVTLLVLFFNFHRKRNEQQRLKNKQKLE